MRALLVVTLLALNTAARAVAPLTPTDYAMLSRVTFGVNAASIQAYRERGRDAYLDWILRYQGDDTLDPTARRQLEALPVQHADVVRLMDAAREDARRIQAMTNAEDKTRARKAAKEKYDQYVAQAAQRRLIRALYARNQLPELLTWFWFNHFNVFQGKGQVRLLLADYEEHAIRPHVLGKFQDLLLATLTHPAMLVYLDNAQNAVRAGNENYARELMELHTLGVGGGYSQQDVQELARILTGVGPNLALHHVGLRPRLASDFQPHALFAFYPSRHDSGEKHFLGTDFPAGRGFVEVQDAVALLAHHPATAHNISRQLAVYFLADDPPAALVEHMQRTFLRSDGDIAATLRVLLTSPEFTGGAYAGAKFKDPNHYVLSALRLLYGEESLQDYTPVLAWLHLLGQPPYGRQTPDGYGLTQQDWASADQMAKRFQVADAMVKARGRLFTPALEEDSGAVRAARRHARDAHPLPVDDLRPWLVPLLSEQTRAVLSRARSADEWAGLVVASPEFMYR
jgi:uncharacterized protein (DUF1800 family)